MTQGSADEGWHPLAGWSMWPLTAPIAAQVTSTKRLERGDIAVFLDTSGKMVFHRVVYVQPSGYITRGDTVLQDDPFVPNEAVIGRVSALSVGPAQLLLPAKSPISWGFRGLGRLWSRCAPGLRWSIRQVRNSAVMR